MKRNIVAVIASLSFVAAAPAVAAVSPTCSGYHPSCDSISSASASKTTTPTTTTTTTTGTGSLPFTGLDLGLLVAGGGSLAGLGFLIRRTSRQTD